jgi:hypothetical protein
MTRPSKPVKAWAVFGPDGKPFADMIRPTRYEAIDTFVSEGEWWPALRKEGCTVRKVTITEGWE